MTRIFLTRIEQNGGEDFCKVQHIPTIKHFSIDHWATETLPQFHGTGGLNIGVVIHVYELCLCRINIQIMSTFVNTNNKYVNIR